MNNNNTKDLFQLQTELVEMKVDMAVSKAIDRVIEKINDLKIDMHNEIHSLRKQIEAIETKLGMNDEKRKSWNDRVMDYLFKTGWVWLSVFFGYVMLHMTVLIK